MIGPARTTIWYGIVRELYAAKYQQVQSAVRAHLVKILKPLYKNIFKKNSEKRVVFQELYISVIFLYISLILSRDCHKLTCFIY